MTATNYGPVATEIDALTAKAEARQQSLSAYARRLARWLGWQDDYRRVFCDEHGNLTEAGARVLADLGRQAGFGTVATGATTEQLHEREAARRVVLHIFARLELGSDRLRNLSTKTREMNNE